MDVIDFHTHVFPDHLAERAIGALKDSVDRARAHTDGTLSGLRGSMLKNGVAMAVLLPVATKPSQVEAINAGCEAQRSRSCVPFGSLHPDSRTMEDDIRRLKARGVKGVKLHPEFQGFYIDDPRLSPVYESLSDAGLIVVFHAGKDPGPFTGDHALPAAFEAVHKRFPRLKIVAAHMGGWMVWDEVDRHMASLPIFFDTSAVAGFLPPREFLKLARKHGTERILFGTDSPWFDQRDVLRWLEASGLGSDEQERILHKNAEVLLGL